MVIKKILLIGKTGQLGEAIMADAGSFSFEIIGFQKDELNILNISQFEKKIKKIKPDILINTSACHAVLKCEENPLEAMAVNFIAVQNLAYLCKKNKIIFVTVSTDYVFDGEKGQPYKETDPPNPLQVYGLSKLAGEYAALNIYSSGTLVIRTCGIFGGQNGSRQKGGNFVLNILKGAGDKKQIEVSSEQIVNPTYAGDLSKAILGLLRKKYVSGIYHLASRGYCSWYDFSKEIFRLANITTKLMPVDRSKENNKVKRPKFSALKNTKAKALGIELPRWQDGLKSYFNFLHYVKK